MTSLEVHAARQDDAQTQELLEALRIRIECAGTEIADAAALLAEFNDVSHGELEDTMLIEHHAHRADCEVRNLLDQLAAIRESVT